MERACKTLQRSTAVARHVGTSAVESIARGACVVFTGTCAQIWACRSVSSLPAMSARPHKLRPRRISNRRLAGVQEPPPGSRHMALLRTLPSCVM